MEQINLQHVHKESYKPDAKPIFSWLTQYNIQQSSQKVCPHGALVVLDLVQRWKHTGQ